MQAPAHKPDCPPMAPAPALPWPSVVLALLAGVGALALLSWVGTNLVI